MKLNIYLSACDSAFQTDLARVREWKGVLDHADAISLNRNGRELVRIELGGPRRWIAFQRAISGSVISCIGYQETVGAVRRGPVLMGGSNRKVLCWLRNDGAVQVGDIPEE